MYDSRVRTWSILTAWLIGAVLCGFLDASRKVSLFLPVFFGSTVVVAVVLAREHWPRNFKFNLVRQGVVRSTLGFEVRVSSSRLEYVEGEHVISLQASPLSTSVGQFNLSENGISGWDSPFDNEPLNREKRREVAKAMKYALQYLQLVDAGKIRPKQVR
jgi:hypothetical protein